MTELCIQAIKNMRRGATVRPNWTRRPQASRAWVPDSLAATTGPEKTGPSWQTQSPSGSIAQDPQTPTPHFMSRWREKIGPLEHAGPRAGRGRRSSSARGRRRRSRRTTRGRVRRGGPRRSRGARPSRRRWLAGGRWLPRVGLGTGLGRGPGAEEEGRDPPGFGERQERGRTDSARDREDVPDGGKPRPYRPQTPIRSPGSSAQRAAVASPTRWTEIEVGDERAMGTSSTPGTQTITNWPGSNANGPVEGRVVTDGVSATTSTIVTAPISRMGAPHDLGRVHAVVPVEPGADRPKTIASPSRPSRPGLWTRRP